MCGGNRDNGADESSRVCLSEWLIEADTLPARGWKHFPGPGMTLFQCLSTCLPTDSMSRAKNVDVLVIMLWQAKPFCALLICAYFIFLANYACHLAVDSWRLVWPENGAKMCHVSMPAHAVLTQLATTNYHHHHHHHRRHPNRNPEPKPRSIIMKASPGCWHVKHATLVTRNVRPVTPMPPMFGPVTSCQLPGKILLEVAWYSHVCYICA